MSVVAQSLGLASCFQSVRSAGGGRPIWLLCTKPAWCLRGQATAASMLQESTWKSRVRVAKWHSQRQGLSEVQMTKYRLTWQRWKKFRYSEGSCHDQIEFQKLHWWWWSRHRFGVIHWCHHRSGGCTFTIQRREWKKHWSACSEGQWSSMWEWSSGANNDCRCRHVSETH